MKYLRIFAEAFAASFGEQLAFGTVWIWRGLYFTGGALLAFTIWHAL